MQLYLTRDDKNNPIIESSKELVEFYPGEPNVKVSGVFTFKQLEQIIAEIKRQIALKSTRMNRERAKELLPDLICKTATGISEPWRERMIEALEFVIERGDK